MTSTPDPAAVPTTWTPEFPGQRPPFTPGNEVAATHGVYSPRKVDPLATELVDRILADPTLAYLQSPAFRPALWAWARAEAKVQLLEDYLAARLDEKGMPDLDDARTVSAYRELHRAETRAQTQRGRLGLDPLSRARLGRDVALGERASLDAAAVMAQLRELEQGGRLPEGGGPA